MTARKATLILTVGLLLLLPMASQAFFTRYLNATFDTNYAGNITGHVYLDGSDRGNVYWGGFKMYDANNTLPANRIADFYCVDVLSYHVNGWRPWTVYATDESPNPYLAGSGITSYPALGWAANLYNTYAPQYRMLDNSGASNRAALQLAIWEALYDGPTAVAGPYSYDFAGGRFRVSATANVGIQTLAGQLLAATRGQSVAGYHHDGQDLMGDIPEPTSVILMGILILGSGMAAMRRRRNS